MSTSSTSPRRSGRRSDQDRLRAIVQRLADGIVILNTEGTIRFANPAAEEIFGRRLAELEGVDLGFPSVVGDSAEIEIVRPGGATVTAEARVVETEWAGERVRLVSIRDISDRKRAAERASQLARERLARAEAEAASHAKSEFLATMSHELRTPLNAVIGYSELLDLGISGPLSDHQREQVQRIRSSARHLLGLVNEVLDLARVEAGRLSVSNRPTSVEEIITAAASLIHPMAESRGIELRTHCDDPTLMFDGDDERVRQILVNLLNNAIKFTHAGGQVTCRCDLATHPGQQARLAGSGPWVCFSVTDTGIGIPAEQLVAIFDPFVQVESGHTRSVEGSGLGLTISRRLARLMGGDLTAQSEPGVGSTFTLWLREATAAQREEARWRAEAPRSATRLHGLADVGKLLYRELGLLIDCFVQRMRDEALVPGVETLRYSQLADHVGAYLADVASMLAAVEDARGQASSLVTEGAEILLHIAERHGAQRARLGWTPKALHREWMLLGEELERVVRRGAGQLPRGAADEAMVIAERLLEQAREQSVRSLVRAAAPAQPPAPR